MKWTVAETETETRESKTTRAVGPAWVSVFSIVYGFKQELEHWNGSQ